MINILKTPDSVVVLTEKNCYNLIKEDNRVYFEDITVSFEEKECGVKVFLKSEHTEIKYVKLRWNLSIPENYLYLGDAWERSYGDLGWRSLVADRAMPWYFLMNNSKETNCFGVKVRPNALCFWQVDRNGITLWLDVRNGGNGVILNGRTLNACTVINKTYNDIDALQAAKSFCKEMCNDPILPKEPVYGFNNWYCSYGNISAEQVVEDTEELSKLVGNRIKNRPFMVIDDGWQVTRRLKDCNGGPWDKGNDKFPDMKELADTIKAKNCRPGIWVRLLNTADETLPNEWRLAKSHSVLDISVPEVIEYIKNAITNIVEWGYELIKHDFSTNDLFDCWGFQMNPSTPEENWSFSDRTRTNAEIIIEFYKAILDATKGKAYILGCNCIGHLGAGLMHIQRIGDDVSGLCWERTRKYGINTLAFRLAQHKAFFDIDADCIGITDKVDWYFNKQWAELVGKSGTPMFVSTQLQNLNAEEYNKIQELLNINSKQTDVIKPLDWMDTTCPEKWSINNEIIKFDWYEKDGISGFNV